MHKRNDVFPVIPFRHQNELRDVNVNAREDSTLRKCGAR
jgi:hypothetical protein